MDAIRARPNTGRTRPDRMGAVLWLRLRLEVDGRGQPLVCPLGERGPRQSRVEVVAALDVGGLAAEELLGLALRPQGPRSLVPEGGMVNAFPARTTLCTTHMGHVNLASR